MPWCIIDPLLCDNDVVETFQTQVEADDALDEYLNENEALWCRCYVEPR